ncbi:MAG: cryptochrome/photolyase family protein [Betaproteobacteria bacterium]|uniref:cryptochrome/photolyase family protein n=1 Tax=Thiomonas TaxID=32012 RepID=UPI0023A49CCD|nr:MULTISPECIES: cryptochrome/photolyase family protein [Thiomonas]MDE1979503.1 cryptochrome/photolyase family protein [Betaproteobacteria bacterium]MDE2269740.1 cryptochrome/photolyase family protein [Betaproteobacteria bacterium]HML82216.1 cryptochrome/photolyase family protein [Thiomonas arsenitoxydans]
MTSPDPARPLRHLVLVLGDQLDPQASAFDRFDPAQDAVWMAEVAEESTHVWSSKPRIALFLAAMRHFAADLRAAGLTVHYTELDDAANAGSLTAELQRAVQRLRPTQLVMTQPGDWRVLQSIEAAAAAHGVPLELREDRHFFASPSDFAAHARGRKQLRMEFFYRAMRQRHDVLMEGNQPAGGQWNFDADNREAFPKSGPGHVPSPAQFVPDAITREVIAVVNQRFASHPGTLADFAWPVTRPQALQALERFMRERLPQFGQWQDALWPNEPWLWHAHLSAALNLKLLNPREVVEAAQTAWRQGQAPLHSAEGFIRQILGWREYVRGIYWTQMPGYAERNALGAQAPLPAWFWTGQTDMACLRDALSQTLRYGYAHHIQRLMVIGLYALLHGVQPQQVHQWFLAVYVDAVEWVELPNTLGMSQAADDGLMASKPYIASGKYIQRMSGGSLCAACRFDPAQRVGAKACPYTTLYWDFLLRHEARLAANPRTVMQVRNLARLSADERARIQAQAQSIRDAA